ncbi:OprO/OprP family phosphate-selective porin [Novosphingobium sp. MBES04]|uniref:OprO/OprP family phosphate-selective porin n=1 Tax=Novosphingobium sp. MBES04 TaxID=1206458 RepID=UPI00057F56AA|nr:porin [Novosphingobium sp. MBES04]GAM04201.1 phosphate-specific outer membrane porin OprP Pyrophosphate-specific outer membrane porin OprO [Novosphingobium sp. MBES04]
MRLLPTSCALVALVAASPALAQTPSREDLADLVRRQAAEIAELRSRVDEIATLRARIEQLEGQGQADGVQLAAGSAPQSEAVTRTETKDAAAKTVHVVVTPPFAPQLVPPGPAERDIARARSANEADVTTEWGAGLPVFHSADGEYTFKPRGRILADVGSTFGSDHDGRNLTTTGMRALRLGFEGGVGTHFFYQIEADFSENRAEIMTAYMGWRDSLSEDVSFDLRMGHLFNDRSFDGSTGSDSTAFLERSVVPNTIVPERGYYGVGAMGRVFFPGGHVSLALTGDRVDGDQTDSDSRTVMARAHVNPLRSKRGALHLGAWGFDEALASSATDLTRNTFMGTRFNGALRVSTGPLPDGTGTTGYGLEFGGYQGPVWFMAEAGERRARRAGGQPDFRTRAYSASAGWFVTGELPPYNPRTGSFGQPHVRNPVFGGGSGALELTSRYEEVSFRNIPNPADGWTATLGANWYLNSFTRIQLNGIYWSITDAAGPYAGSDSGQTLAARLGVTF